MSETLHFSYRSIGRILNLCCTIEFEKAKGHKELQGLWHEVFRGKRGDALFEELAEREYPKGYTLGEAEIKHIMFAAVDYLEDSDDLQAERNEAIMRFCNSWVYCKPLHKVVKCDFGNHTNCVIDMVAEFFGKEIDEVEDKKLKKFINEGFLLRSANTKVSQLAADVEHIKFSAGRRARRLGTK